ncbi:MAG: winged helix-turn-helix transcriptional regulator [Candidatus Hodarchaeales archaeon]|jgi:predicted transcriptional regulator
MNNQILNVDFSSPISLDLQSLFKRQISQITSLFLVTSELFGLDGSVNGALLFIGTISIGKQKYQETKKESSRNRNRLVIKESINKNPGISLREIHRKTNLAMGVVQYHIHCLESGEVGEIESFKLGRSKHFFVSSTSFSIKEKVWFSLNRNKNIENILDLLGTSNTQCSQKDLSQITGNSKSLISYYIKILRLKGIIELENRQLKISEEFTEINNKFFSEKA